MTEHIGKIVHIPEGTSNMWIAGFYVIVDIEKINDIIAFKLDRPFVREFLLQSIGIYWLKNDKRVTILVPEGNKMIFDAFNQLTPIEQK